MITPRRVAVTPSEAVMNCHGMDMCATIASLFGFIAMSQVVDLAFLLPG